MWIARLPTASAASFTASVSVGCAWQVRARSSADPPNSISTAASAIMLPGIRPDDMDAEHAVGLGIGEDFDEAVGLPVHLRAPIGCEGEFANIVCDPAPFSSSSVWPMLATSGKV